MDGGKICDAKEIDCQRIIFFAKTSHFRHPTGLRRIMSTTPAGPTVSRRTVATSLAWSIPAVTAASAAPAFAASRLAGCQTIAWSSFTGSEGTGGVLTADLGNGNTMSVSQKRTSGQTGNVNGTNYDFKRSAVDTQKAEAYNTKVTLPATTVVGMGTGYNIPEGSTTSVLTLNQGSSNAATPASETLTFSFPTTPESVTFNIYDITSATGSRDVFQSRYTGKVNFGGIDSLTIAKREGLPNTYTEDATSIAGTSYSTSTGNYVRVTLSRVRLSGRAVM